MRQLRAFLDGLRSRITREQSLLASTALAYIVTGKLGVMLGDGFPTASLVWPPSGIALGALLIAGYRIWPVLVASSVALYAYELGPMAVAAIAGRAAGDTTQALLTAYLVNRYAGGRHALQTPGNSLRFAGVVMLANMTTGAMVNTLVLVTTGFVPWTEYGTLWATLALGSMVGMLLVAPQVLLYGKFSLARVSIVQMTEAATATLAIGVLAALVFFPVPPGLRGLPVELLCLPLLLWIAFRLGRRAAAAALLVISVFAIYGTLSGNGPFVRSTPFASLVVVQLFVGINAVIALSLAALASEYQVAERQLRELVVTDPLTGLPNYRRLVEVMSDEIAKADQQKRDLAVVFFDMDGLKEINDRFGHLVGSRAVCRFAETLKAGCRTTDTAARYGGDEFVAVLPDTDDRGAWLVVQRIMDRLREDRDQPAISVSAGVAVYPRDGRTPTTLLSAADRKLYAAKANRAPARPPHVVGIRDRSAPVPVSR